MNTTPQPRQPIGVPAGGQWADREHAESEIMLGAETARSQTASGAYDDAERHRAMLEHGYVPPTFSPALDDPRTTRQRRPWWDQHFVSGEHRSDDAGYPKMPDDYTRSKSGGRALSGHRRTHRMAYSAPGVTLRMPSASACKRYAAETGSTFDVPVSAVEESGKSLSGWVRVTNTGPGSWSAQGLGFGGYTDAKVSEALSSVLEARRPSRGLVQTGDLLQRHRERVAAHGAELSTVTPGWVSAVGYDEDEGLMVTQTSRGDVYGHQVDQDSYDAVRGGYSPGRAFNQLVKGSPRAQVAQCEHCGRFHAATTSHSCPPDATMPPDSGGKESNLAARTRARQVAAEVGRHGTDE